jgi:ribose transport system permease protein
MAGVLALLCAYYSWATLKEQQPRGEAAARSLAGWVKNSLHKNSNVLIVAKTTDEDRLFADTLEAELKGGGYTVAGKVLGDPRAARVELKRISETGAPLPLIATTTECAAWTVFENLSEKFPQFGKVEVRCAPSYRWPTFLKSENILNVANQIVIVAIIAVGMTMVIITGGIDLSVGSLIALAAVLAALLIRDFGGGEQASAGTLILCSAAGIIACGIVGFCSGVLVAIFKLPAFIATLGMMLIASGLAYILSNSNSINAIPDSYTWLGVGRGFFSLPHAVVLMLLIYAAAHVLMSRTTLGRYIYAVGGNSEAARLAGVRVNAVLLFAYTISGLAAGLGGILMASQFKSASPQYGAAYELNVIAAVVVGGTSLSGGEGKIFGTLIGGFIIAVVQNGMNLTSVNTHMQKVVLGAIIIGAVLLDRAKKLLAK